MKRIKGIKSIKTILAVFILIAVFTVNVYGFEASNHYELENVIFEQMNKYNLDFNIKYTGSLENIEETLKKLVEKDIYLKSNISRVDWSIITNKTTSNIKVNVSYIISSEERAQADKLIDGILASIIKPYMNDHEKVKAVHDYIVLNGSYDESFMYYSDYDLLTKGKSVCNGYALLTYNMLSKLNIPVKLVSGFGSDEAHIWNMVKLGDYWFHLDTTWNDPYSDMSIISYSYYMLTEKEITKDHTIDKGLNIPKSTKRYYDYLKESKYNKLLVETGLDMYDEENSAKNEAELKNLLNHKIAHHPLRISVRFDKSISQDSIINAISQLYKYDYISAFQYNHNTSDITGEWNILNLFITYKETPEKLILDFPRTVNNTATNINFNVYAMYGNKKVNITKDVFIYPYDTNKINISNGTLKFMQAGNYRLLFN